MLSPDCLVSVITATALAISEGKSADELSALGSIFTQLGDTLTTISIQMGLCESRCKDSNSAQAKLDIK